MRRARSRLPVSRASNAGVIKSRWKVCDVKKSDRKKKEKNMAKGGDSRLASKSRRERFLFESRNIIYAESAPCVIQIGVQRVILILMCRDARTAPLVRRNRVVKSAANLVKPRPRPANRFIRDEHSCRCFDSEYFLPFPRFFLFPLFSIYLHTCVFHSSVPWNRILFKYARFFFFFFYGKILERNYFSSEILFFSASAEN